MFQTLIHAAIESHGINRAQNTQTRPLVAANDTVPPQSRVRRTTSERHRRHYRHGNHARLYRTVAFFTSIDRKFHYHINMYSNPARKDTTYHPSHSLPLRLLLLLPLQRPSQLQLNWQPRRSEIEGLGQGCQGKVLVLTAKLTHVTVRPV